MNQEPPAGTTQSKEIILEITEQQNPENTDQLIKILEKRTTLSRKEIIQFITELEHEGKLNFSDLKASPPTTSRSHIFTNQSVWSWITISLAAITAVAEFTIPVNAYPIVYLRYALGVSFMLFLPGFALLQVIYPLKLPFKTDNGDLYTVERIALSLGLSMALVLAISLVLNYSPWGLRLTPVTLSLLGLTVTFTAAGMFRAHSISQRND